MASMSHHLWAPMMSLFLAVSLTSLTNAAPYGTRPQSSTASQQDKAKASNDLVDKNGLQGQDLKTFMQSYLNNAVNSGPGSNVSEQDKATACKNLADKKGLKGADRRSFIKNCMNKANP